MVKVASMDEARRKRSEKLKTHMASACEHKEVIVYASERSVRCALCGASLDPFDVLVDLIQRYGPDR
jgi:ribosomal protein S27E